MGDLTNASGRGPVGTGTNNPISDGGTMSLTQNRPNGSQGTLPDSGSSARAGTGLTEADRDFIGEIHRSRHLDGTHLRLDELLYLRAENARMQEEAIREFGPRSKSAIWFQNVIEAYDEEIARAKSPLGSAVNDLKRLLTDPTAKEKDFQPKIMIVLGVMRQQQLLGVDDDSDAQEAMALIEQALDRASDDRNAALEELVYREKRGSGAVSDDKFREAIAVVMGIERQRQLLGMSEDEAGEAKSRKVSQAVSEVVHLVSERRINSLKALIDQEKQSTGSVSDQQFTNLVAAVLGDERQKALMGISDDPSGGMAPVIEVMVLTLKRRQAAVADLFTRQAVPGSGVTTKQVNQAIKDYEAIKDQARRFGMAVPDGDFTLGAPTFEK